jgi:type II protein arginine methyltransferase
MSETLAALLADAIELHAAGRTAEACARYREVLARDARNARAAHPLGVLMLQAGRLDEAVALLGVAVAAAPRWAEAANNYGVALRETGRAGEAIEAFRAATAARPVMFDAHNNLAEALLEVGDAPGALAAAERARALDAHRPEPLLTAGMAHLLLRNASSAVLQLRECAARWPEHETAAELLRVARGRVLPAWHFAMLNEAPRNEAYDAAIRRAVAEGALVLDIGAGSGLLSMMAARAGAGRVVACEMVPALADKARAIVARNGYAAAVTVHAARSHELRVGAELPRRADALVSEILDSDVLGEGVLDSLEDAHARLLAPGAAVVPRAAIAMIVLAGGAALSRSIAVGECAGFDVSDLNEFAPERVIFDGSRVAFERYSEPAEGLRFDFREAHHPAAEGVVEIPVTRSGPCVGVIQWLKIEADEHATYENSPDASADNPGNWLHSLYPFQSVVDVRAGQTVRLRAGHSRDALFFQLLEVVG